MESRPVVIVIALRFAFATHQIVTAFLVLDRVVVICGMVPTN